MSFIVPKDNPSVALSDSAPKSEGMKPVAGTAGAASRADHIHERLTSAFDVTLDSNGYADVKFSRTFVKKPALAYASLDNLGGPVPDFSASLVIENGLYVGARVYGERKKALPLLTGLALIGNLITALTGYKAWEPAAGAVVCVVAIESTKV